MKTRVNLIPKNAKTPSRGFIAGPEGPERFFSWRRGFTPASPSEEFHRRNICHFGVTPSEVAARAGDSPRGGRAICFQAISSSGHTHTHSRREACGGESPCIA